MLDSFSQQLIDEARDYFSDLYQKEITAEEAECFLRSLSRLADCFINN